MTSTNDVPYRSRRTSQRPDTEFDLWLKERRWGILYHHRWLAFVLPLVWMGSTSIKPETQALTRTWRVLPRVIEEDE